MVDNALRGPGKMPLHSAGLSIRDKSRTHDSHVGNVMLYHPEVLYNVRGRDAPPRESLVWR